MLIYFKGHLTFARASVHNQPQTTTIDTDWQKGINCTCKKKKEPKINKHYGLANICTSFYTHERSYRWTDRQTEEVKDHHHCLFQVIVAGSFYLIFFCTEDRRRETHHHYSHMQQQFDVFFFHINNNNTIQHAYGIDGLMDGLVGCSYLCMFKRMNTILLNAYHSDTKHKKRKMLKNKKKKLKNYENKRCWIVLLFFVHFNMSVPNKIK